jgi:hypothetical protein
VQWHLLQDATGVQGRLRNNNKLCVYVIPMPSTTMLLAHVQMAHVSGHTAMSHRRGMVLHP